MVVNPIPVAPLITLSENTLMSSAPSGNQWYFEGNPISGATGQTHVATLSGWYWCNVTLNGCSSGTSNHVHVIVTGIEELPEATVRVYPSPTTGKFILELKGELPVYKVVVDVYDMIGEKVLTEILFGERSHEFSLSDRPVGVYFIRVISGDKAETIKIIKQ